MSDSNSDFHNVPDEYVEMQVITNPKSLHHCALFLSQYALILFIVSFVGFGFLYPRYHPSKIYNSVNSSVKWNSTANPKIIVHLTDVHLAESEPQKIVSFKATAHTAKYYGADFYLLTGDMVDNYGKKNWPKIGKQVREDWELWKEIFDEEIGDAKVVDVAGNHDMWGIGDPLSEQNLFLDYSASFTRENTKTLRDFHVKKIVENNITFVLINQYRFPDVHPPYTYWAHPSKRILDEVEEVISNAGPCMVACHYPVDHNWWVKSSKGHTFEQIMESPNIISLFSGHFHPIGVQIIHHEQGAVEYIGPGAYQFKMFGVFTIDNDRMVYHNIDVAATANKFLLTHPVPKDQLSSHQIFNEENTEIRLISYAQKNVTIRVEGAVNGILKYSHTLPNGADIYSLPLDVKEGEHSILLTGDGCKIRCDFYVGNQIKGKKEEAACYQRGLLFMKISFIPMYICALWMLFPSGGLLSSKTEKWIEGSIHGSFGSYWISSIFLGPNLIRTRLLALPKSVRYMLFGFIIYPLFLPLHFFEPFFGLQGFAYLCFVVIDGHLLFDEWSIHMTYFYVLVLIIPATILISSFKYKGKSWVFVINCLITWGLLFGICVVNYRWVGESVSIINLFLNPTFVIIPVAMHTVFYFKVFRNKDYYGSNIQRSQMEHTDTIVEAI